MTLAAASHWALDQAAAVAATEQQACALARACDRLEDTGQKSQTQSECSGKDAVHATTRKAGSSGAQATARWRERRRQGSMVVPVELYEREMEVLVQVGLLPREQSHDRELDRAGHRRNDRSVRDATDGQGPMMRHGGRPSGQQIQVMDHSRRGWSDNVALRCLDRDGDLDQTPPHPLTSDCTVCGTAPCTARDFG